MLEIVKPQADANLTQLAETVNKILVCRSRSASDQEVKIQIGFAKIKLASTQRKKKGERNQLPSSRLVNTFAHPNSEVDSEIGHDKTINHDACEKKKDKIRCSR